MVGAVVEAAVVGQDGVGVLALHGVGHDVHLPRAGIGQGAQHGGHVFVGGAVLAGGHAVLQVDALHGVGHGGEVQVHAGHGHGVEGADGRRLLGVAVGLVGSRHPAVAAPLGVGRGLVDAGQLQEKRVGHAHVVGHVGDEDGGVGGHGVEQGLVGMTPLGQQVLIVVVAQDDAVGADMALLGEGAQRVGDLLEGGTAAQIGIEQVLEGAGEVAVGVDEPRYHGRAAQVYLLGALAEGAGLLDGAHVGDAAVVVDEHRLGASVLVGEGNERCVAEQLAHRSSFRGRFRS